MALVANGKLTIPLYHGTSDLFYESILKFGLGGRNVIEEMRVIELLGRLISICQTNLPNEQQWLVKMQSARSVAQQNVSRGGFNFRHGSVYLTPSSCVAANYATSSEYGSEVLGHFMMLWDRLCHRDIKTPEDVANGAQPIIKFCARPKRPILIRLESVPASMLSAENGGDATSVFQWIEKFVEDKDMWQPANFELRAAVHVGEGDIFRIVKYSRGSVKEPSLMPYRR